MTTRILIPIAAFLGAIAITLFAAFLPWIPEWKMFPRITAILGILGALTVAVLLIRGIWLQTRERMKLTFRIILAMIIGCGTVGAIFVTALVTTFSLDRGLFDPIFKRKFDFPEHGTTIYVYDGSFFDPETIFRVRHGFFPLMYDAGRFGGYDPDHLEIVQEGEWAVYEDFAVHLPTGQIAQ